VAQARAEEREQVTAEMQQNMEEMQRRQHAQQRELSEAVAMAEAAVAAAQSENDRLRSRLSALEAAKGKSSIEAQVLRPLSIS
jgi:hypothetical protein